MTRCVAYLAEEQYDEQEENDSDTDRQNDRPERYRGRPLYSDVRERTSSRLHVPPAPAKSSQVKSSQVAFNKMKVTSAHTHTHTHTYTHTHPFNGLCPGLPGSAGTRKVKPIWISLKQETVSGSGISRAVRKSAPRSRQITTLAPPPLSFLQAGRPSCRPTNGVKALKA